MALDVELLELMVHEIAVYPMVGFNEYAEPAFSTEPTVYRCKVDEQPTMVRNQFGDEVVATHQVYVAATDRIPMTSRIVLPDGTEPPLIRSTVYWDELGDIHHVGLFFGSGASA